MSKSNSIGKPVKARVPSVPPRLAAYCSRIGVEPMLVSGHVLLVTYSQGKANDLVQLFKAACRFVRRGYGYYLLTVNL
jgi:hypothetical protein